MTPPSGSGGGVSISGYFLQREQIDKARAPVWTPGLYPLRRGCLSAVSDPLLDPSLYLLRQPRHSASSKLHPFRELAGSFEARDVSEAVGDTIDRFEFLLRYELPLHHKSLFERDVATPG